MLLSIVTVTYNAASCIALTLQSILSQTVASEIELILVDGGSTDETLNIIRHRFGLTEGIENTNTSIPGLAHLHILSEPDHGIYDAMNKGARLASAPWIVFMNAGDAFYNEDTVESLSLGTTTPDHLIYGDCVRVWNDGHHELRIARPFFAVRGGVPGIGICHQSIYQPTRWMQEHPFRWQQYPHSADFEQIYSYYQQGLPFQYVKRPLSLYAYGDGFSSCPKAARTVLDENARISGRRHSFSYYKLLIRQWLSSHC